MNDVRISEPRIVGEFKCHCGAGAMMQAASFKRPSGKVFRYRAKCSSGCHKTEWLSDFRKVMDEYRETALLIKG